ncbi:MAG TPA: DNA polymerase III subunit gamma/tau [Bacteroidia bacterium]|jgi:DNA polymerase-3 subunit gamma/tau|nr:DNA polymerase III subunit gamma/tau [Bacteroidia bacterium]
MERFVVSARKYRPQTFLTVVGQQHITTTLKNSIKNNHLAQAFLFCGPRGVGKTTCARILAKTINCFNRTADTEACDECDSCKSFNSGQSLNVFELDAASNNSVEDIRNLIDQVRFAPQLGSFKVYIIDEVHMLSASAFNAFLKTLEEPPRHAIFILATTEKHKIIPTILSRCQIFDFNRIRLEDISNHLGYIAKTEGITAEAEALRVIAQKADGGLRDACSMFDQMVSFGGNNLTYKTVIANLHVLDYDYYFKVTDALNTQDVSAVLLTFNEIINNGFDGHHFIAGLGEHIRNILVCKDTATVQLIEVSEDVKQKYLQQAQNCNMQFLLKALGIINRCDVSYKSAKNQRLQVEIALLQMSYLNAAPVMDAEKKNDDRQIVEQTVTAAPEKTSTEGVSIVKEEIPQYKTTDKPITSFKDLNLTSGFRLQQAKQLVQQPAVVEEAVKEIPVVQNEEVSLKKFRLAAQAYAKEKNKMLLTALLRPEMINKLEGEIAVIEIENISQKEGFESYRQDFLDFIRKFTNNNVINFHFEEKKQDGVKKAYSPIEKFEAMIEKNPLLKDLKSRLDMELDY